MFTFFTLLLLVHREQKKSNYPLNPRPEYLRLDQS